MKVIAKTKEEKGLTFGDLEVGEVFRFGPNNFCKGISMRTDGGYVDLESGYDHLVHRPSDVDVFRVSGAFVED